MLRQQTGVVLYVKIKVKLGMLWGRSRVSIMLSTQRIHEAHDVKSICWRWLNEPLTTAPP